MSLNKQISQFRIVANSTNYDLAVQSMDILNEGEDYTDILTAIGGKKYKDMAGLRVRIQIRYDESVEATTWRNMINDILTHFITNSNESMEFYPDNTNTTASDKIDVIPTNTTYLTSYNNQIGVFQPSIDLVSVDRITTITSNFEAP